MLTYKAKLIGWLLVLGMVLACVPSLATPLPPADPGAINTFIAQTVNAASTQTAAARPTSTHTATITPTPRNTDTVTPTFTSTVIFILSTPTSLVIPTFTIVSSGGSSSDNYACQVTSVSPANGTAFGSRADFDAIWRVKNIGQKAWDRTQVDYRYTSGTKIHKTAIYDLNANVPKNGTADLIVDMVAPKDPGSYTTVWNLYVGSKSFCNMSLRIIVQ
ncbi:MAG: hypothetical protein L0287_05005 [Anaerolineae bacterium]|nr:hypothetical protein [Anaerolineae bacterium]MCI0608634.1 hypothetical protein [Anaerolineae bacterium]